MDKASPSSRRSAGRVRAESRRRPGSRVVLGGGTSPRIHRRCTRGASCRYSHDPNASGWDPNFGRRDARRRRGGARLAGPLRRPAAVASETVCAVSVLMLSWPNGQGVALLRRRLWVRVPPGATKLTLRTQALAAALRLARPRLPPRRPLRPAAVAAARPARRLRPPTATTTGGGRRRATTTGGVARRRGIARRRGTSTGTGGASTTTAAE